MNPEATGSAADPAQHPMGNVVRPGSRSKRTFAMHFLEMVVVMLVGMGVFSGLAALAFGLAGSGMSDQPGAIRVTLMGVNMAVPMALWMGLRGHPALRNLEMAASMLLPTFVAAVLVWAGAVNVMAGMTIQHAVMVPAMLAVMLWRYDEYAQPHGRRHH
jgi:hypothetical protein